MFHFLAFWRTAAIRAWAVSVAVVAAVLVDGGVPGIYRVPRGCDESRVGLLPVSHVSSKTGYSRRVARNNSSVHVGSEAALPSAAARLYIFVKLVNIE